VGTPETQEGLHGGRIEQAVALDTAQEETVEH